MATLQLNTKINASKEKIWGVLWDDTSYRRWAAVFMEGSHAVSDWNEGSEIRFLGTKNDGMFGIIEKKIPNQQMTFKHEGEIKNGIKEVNDWGEATESYFLSENNGVTDLAVVLSMKDNSEFEEYFRNTFPKALEIIKQISEGE